MSALAESRTVSGIQFMGWYSADKTLTVDQKIEAACARYRSKHGVEPDICLCNPTDAEAVQGVELTVTSRHHIPVNTFFIGRMP